MLEYGSLAIMVALTCCGQVLMKKGAAIVVYRRGVVRFLKTFANPYVIAGAIAVLCAPVFYIFALTRLSLSVAYAFTGFNYIFVLLASWLFLKEKINIWQCVGTTLIFAGVVVFNL